MNDGISIEVESEKNVFVPVKTYIYLFVKRIFDIIVSIIGCAFLVPIALVIKIVYMLNKDFDSIFFTQTRIGKNGKEFNFYKFRSMVPNADEVLTKLLKKNKKLARE